MPKFALPAIVHSTSRCLILGTLPGDQSLAAQFYYLHPRNQFWRIMQAVFADEPGLTSVTRAAFLARHQLALWDVLHAAERVGSLDTAITNPIPNDFQTFFTANPAIQKVGLNGMKAQQLFMRLVWPNLTSELQSRLELVGLPSTSPANTQAFAKKVEAWMWLRNALGA
ncbi:DNA-deoxyinosine glycosylase [Herpetosiphon sp.]|uniref:G:T/U mismatch-specific DNA glycosylase-like protein n=1 Tax=Herpetosiphon aurantiacus (strain ATCC 23779 / DSM 785 / 114-95) TaxID=316274 RepID=A9AVD1_HERA2|nr:DNA-deoxyinosine glycosylase [Herpetosiphon sp.]ABX04622.1 G:T/U mismatch-specific DNA glycosylase-like protein [Herpetosiphon aurantiacus DSM 785]